MSGGEADGRAAARRASHDAAKIRCAADHCKRELVQIDGIWRHKGAGFAPRHEIIPFLDSH